MGDHLRNGTEAFDPPTYRIVEVPKIKPYPKYFHGTQDYSDEQLTIAFMDAINKKKHKRDIDAFEEFLIMDKIEPKLAKLRKERADLRTACNACVFKLEGEPAERLPNVERDEHFTRSFDSLEYKKVDPDNPNESVTITDQQIDSTGAWKQYAQMINGNPGIGKTPAHISKAKIYCRRREKTFFVKVKGSIEPLVILSKKGILAEAGAVICEDFSLDSVRGSLTDEDIKTLFDVRDGGCIESKRWGHIEFPPGLPRLFSFNEPAETLLKICGAFPSGHQKAQLKRVCVAGYKELVATSLISASAKTLLARTMSNDQEDDQDREQAWWISRGGRAQRVEGIVDGFRDNKFSMRNISDRLD